MKNRISSIYEKIKALRGPNDGKEVPKKVKIARISAKELKTRLDNAEEIIFLDVRSPEEYTKEHIAKALSLPLDKLEEEAKALIPDKQAHYCVYCRSGNRSVTATAQLVKMGYQNIYQLGGINDWPYDKAGGNT